MEKYLAKTSDTLDNAKAPRLKVWRELAIFASIIMELSWAVLWYRAFISTGDVLPYGRVFLVFGGILLFSYLVTRVMNHLNLRMMLQRIIFVGVILISMLVGLELLIYTHETLSLGELLSREIHNFRDVASLIPPEFILLLIVLFVCWRGMLFVGKHIAPENVIGSFRTGVFLFVIYGVFFAFSDSAPIFTLYIFLFFSLLAMSIARISILGVLRGGQSIPFNKQWFLGIIVIVLAIVSVSAVAVSLLKDQGFNFIFDIFTWLIRLLVLVITPLMWLMTWVIEHIWDWLNIEMMFLIFIEAIKRLQSILVEVMDTINSWFGKMGSADLRQFFISLGVAKPYILWGTILIFAILLLLTIRRHFWNDQEEDDGEYQSLLDQEDMFGLLRSALRKGLGKVVDGLEQIMRLRHARRMLAAARIRRIYSHLMDLSAKLGQPRPPSRTPLEFIPDLVSIFPTLSMELGTITNAYLRVRYGELPETHQEVERVETAWKRVRSLGKEKLRTKIRLRVGPHLS